MKTNIRILVIVLIAMIAGCDNDDSFTVSDEPETFSGMYALPQGDHDYDDRIVALSNKYYTLIYYKFVDRDYYWGVNSDIRWKYDSITEKTTVGYEITQADEDYVGEQLDLFENYFLKYFPDTLLTRTMPYKVLLASRLDYINYTGVGYPPPANRILNHAFSGYDYMVFNWGNEGVKTMTAEEINMFKAQGTARFLQRLAEKGLIKRSSQFISVTNYTASMNTENMYDFGILYFNERNINGDWRTYVENIVSTPYDVMIGEGGILSPEVDTKGLIRKKYDLMIEHFMKEYNIDLQAIGNDVVM